MSIRSARDGADKGSLEFREQLSPAQGDAGGLPSGSPGDASDVKTRSELSRSSPSFSAREAPASLVIECAQPA
jgi:hypothetical protein